jgi:hypothetical protein
MVDRILSPNGEIAPVRIKEDLPHKIIFETFDSDFDAEFEIPKPPVAQLREYDYYFFHKNGIADTDTFQLRIKKKSIGWCVPISALDNTT